VSQRRFTHLSTSAKSPEDSSPAAGARIELHGAENAEEKSTEQFKHSSEGMAADRCIRHPKN
jgi:hypothetical protein